MDLKFDMIDCKDVNNEAMTIWITYLGGKVENVEWTIWSMGLTDQKNFGVLFQ